MAELVQGPSAPVGMKPEGFVDALHRVRQIASGLIVLEEGLRSLEDVVFHLCPLCRGREPPCACCPDTDSFPL